ncbi:MAG: PrsW family intramembrane metalloprotease [Solobacterium sp.]|nr:PrsW family intramembrane metalloprotease [Solobacterium sp.]
MGVMVLGLLASGIPSLALFLWLRKQNEEETYRKTCNKAIFAGMAASFLVVLFSLVLSLFGNAVLHVHDEGKELLAAFWKAFFVFALSEETAKFLMFRRLLKKTGHPYSVRDLAAFMTLVGMGFGILEGIVYGFSTNVIQMLVRGATLGHGGYGFLMGLYYGKGRQTGKKKYYVLSCLVPYLLHALYDFTLSDAVEQWNDNLVIVPVTLAMFSLVLVFIIIRWMKKARNDEALITPLAGTEAHEV